MSTCTKVFNIAANHKDGSIELFNVPDDQTNLADRFAALAMECGELTRKEILSFKRLDCGPSA